MRRLYLSPYWSAAHQRKRAARKGTGRISGRVAWLEKWVRLIWPPSNPVPQDADYHVDIVIIRPEETDTLRVDLKFLLKLKHYVMNSGWPNRLTRRSPDHENEFSETSDFKRHRI